MNLNQDVKVKGVGKAAALGLSLLVVLGVFFGLRYMGVSLPFLWSQSQAAPEGTAITISLLAFCKDNTTEVVAIKEYKLSQMSLLSPAGKEIKYFAVTATFLTGPPTGETLQQLDLSYEIAVKTSAGVALSPVKRTVHLPIVAGLALHQSQAIPLSLEELGLVKVGDVTQMTVDVSVQADMIVADAKGNANSMRLTSTGHVESQVKYEEGGYARIGGIWGQATQKGQGYAVAYLGGSFTKPEWRVLGVVKAVDSSGNKYHIIDDSNPDTPPDVKPDPKPPDPKPPDPNPPPPTPPPYEPPPDIDREPPTEPPPHEAYESSEHQDFAYGFTWLENFAGALRGFFNSYKLLLPYRVTSTLVIDLFPVIVGIFAIVLVAVGLALSRKKG